jgi:hypothetical protein
LIEQYYHFVDLGFVTEASRENMKSLETSCRQLLVEQEAFWRLKSWDIWLDKGDENKKSFHAFEKG